MRVLAFAVLVACSSKSEKPKPAEPKLPNVVRAICPKGVLSTHAWTHEVFPACAPPQLRGYEVTCDGACPKPCKRHTEMAGTPHVIELQYDDKGRYVGGVENGKTTHSCEYDAAGRMTTCSDYEGPATIERDDNGRIASVRNAEGQINRFSYDAQGRVTRIYEALLGDSELVYDAAGWLVREKMTSPDDELVYHYDAQGRVTHFDATKMVIDHNTYDAQGRLVEKAYVDTKETYAYDAKGRVVEYVRVSEGEAPFERTRFEYCD